MSTTNQPQTEDCPICFLPMQKGAAIFTTACGHTFHFDCIKSSIQHNNATCPLCRGGMNQLTNVIRPAAPVAPPMAHPPTRMPVSNAHVPPHPHPLTRMPAAPPVLTSAIPPGAPYPGYGAPYPGYGAPMPTPAPYGPYGSPYGNPYANSIPSSYNSRGSAAIPPEDSIEDVKVVASNAGEASEEGVFSLKPVLEVTEFPFNESKNMYGMLSVKAPSSSSKQRVPLDLVAVVDHSGSMSGSKIALLKQTLQYMVTQLSGDDRFSIVSFDDRVAVLCGLKRMTEQSKSGLDFLIQTSPDLNASGGTDIGLGLKTGLEVLRSRKAKNAVTSILLLTDGQDGQALNNIRSQLSGIPDGCAVHTFGFGSDHDAVVLSSVAEMTKGTFTYIENVGTVGEAFATCLGGLLSVVAQSLTVHIETADKHTISKVHTSYSSQVKTNDGKSVAEIKLNDLFADEKRDFVFTFNVPALPAPKDENIVGRAHVTYRQPLQDKVLSTVEVEFKIKRPDHVAPGVTINPDIEVQRNRILAAEAMENAVKEADRGNLTAANSILQAASATIKQSPQVASPLNQNLLDDLTNCTSKMRTQQDYSQGGHAYAKSAMMQHQQQRAVAQPSPSPMGMPVQSAYSTPAQMANVSAFQAFQQQQQLQPQPSLHAPVFHQQPQQLQQPQIYQLQQLQQQQLQQQQLQQQQLQQQQRQQQLPQQPQQYQQQQQQQKKPF